MNRQMLLHVSHAYECGYRGIAIHATDTDVVIAITFVAKPTLSEVWLAFGYAQHSRYIATHVIAEVLPAQMVFYFDMLCLDVT